MSVQGTAQPDGASQKVLWKGLECVATARKSKQKEARTTEL